MTPGEIFDSQQNGTVVDVSPQMVSFSNAFIETNMIALGVQRLPAGVNVICLTIRQRLMRCHWSCDPRGVKISGHSEQLGPCESTSHFINNLSQNAGCVLYWGFWPNWWGKFEQEIPKSQGATCIRGVSYIRKKMVNKWSYVVPWFLLTLDCADARLFANCRIHVWSTP